MQTDVPFEALVHAAELAGLDATEAIHPDYVGRGMTGAPGCVGIEHETVGELLKFAIKLNDRLGGGVYGMWWAGHARQEQIGERTITYWPAVSTSRPRENFYAALPYDEEDYVEDEPAGDY